MPGQQHVDEAGTDDLVVLLPVGMGAADNEIGALAPQSRRFASHRIHGRQEADVAGGGDLRRVRQRHAEDAELDDAEIEDATILVAGQDRTIRCAHVGGEPGEARFLTTLEVGLRAEVELVVARDEQVGRSDVAELDRVGALVEAGHQRRGEHVAGVHVEQRGAACPLHLDDGVQPGEAAAAVLLAHLVDVVDEQEGDHGGAGPGRLSPGGAGTDGGKARAQSGCQGVAAGYAAHRDLVFAPDNAAA
ncbi:MAG: hypothetical protein FD152_1747 [Xanthobacteraceae bacterium]|nr:MAG: hypothetical protein FD152_1747 [Xanthobacteraceae bacterium]